MRTVVLVAVVFLTGLMAGEAAPGGANEGVELSHFKCYSIMKGDASDPDHIVVLRDQFVEETHKVQTASLVCTPTLKRIVRGPAPEAPTGVEDHLKCYLIPGTLRPDEPLSLHNQLGAERLRLERPRLLCVPTSKGVDQIIDLDGIATATPGGPADRQVTAGNALTSWPTGGGDQGIDMFDNDGNAAWTFGAAGDDLHLEDPTGACSTGARNAVHDLGEDCKVLDIDGSLFDGQPVSCDFEFGAFCAPGLPGNIKFHDANSDGLYDNAEDIVLDVNGNGVFD